MHLSQLFSRLWVTRLTDAPLPGAGFARLLLTDAFAATRMR